MVVKVIFAVFLSYIFIDNRNRRTKMNEKLQYATMLEIPVNTCNVTLKQGKKKKSGGKKVKNPDKVKEELMQKINSETDFEQGNVLAQDVIDDQMELQDQPILDNIAQDQQDGEEQFVKPPKKRNHFSIIATQLVVIGVLIATICVTNVINADSGINVFFRNVFGTKQAQVVDTRTHQDFAPVLAIGQMSEITVDNGVMTFSGEGSVYAPCDGVVTSVAKDGNGRFILEITHNDNFKSVISGVDMAYSALNDTVYSNIPVGYVNADGATMCFKSGDDVVISNYEIVDGAIVWAV